MKIRKAKKEDLKRIDEIYLEGVIDEIKSQFPKRSNLSILREMNKAKKERLKGFEKELKSNKSFWLVVEIEKKIVGFANTEINKNKEGKLTMLYVDKKFRKKGIGKKLTKERIKWLKKKGVKNISAGMFINNKFSRKNLEKFGFKPVAIRMEKKLK